MPNDPKKPTKGDDQQSDIESGEISAEDLKKVAGGRSMSHVYNAGKVTLSAKTTAEGPNLDTGAVRKK